MPSRRRAVAVLIGALALAGLGPAVTAAPGPEVDWFTLTVTGGPSGSHDVQLVLMASGVVDAAGPLVIGTGFASRYGSGVFATPALSGETAITTSRDLGGQRITVDETGPGRMSVTSVGSLGDLREGESVVVLHAFSHARLRVRAVLVDAAGGSVTTNLTQGTGTRALVLADPTGDGASVNAAVGGAGAPTYAARLPTGAVGAFTSCVVCTADWHAPGANTGTYLQTPVAAGSPSFAGPAGDWSWSWAGAARTSAGPTAIGLVVPIGEAWPRFKPAHMT